MNNEAFSTMDMSPDEAAVFRRQPVKAYLMWKLICARGDVGVEELSTQMGIRTSTVGIYLNPLVITEALIFENSVYRVGTTSLSQLAQMVNEPKDTRQYLNKDYKVTMNVTVEDIKLGIFGNGCPFRMIRVRVKETFLSKGFEPPVAHTKLLEDRGQTWSDWFSGLDEVTIYDPVGNDGFASAVGFDGGAEQTVLVEQGRYLYFRGWVQASS